MPLGETEQILLRGWLVAITIFEIPNFHNYLVKGGKLDGFWSTMLNAGPEKRCWCFGLALLCLSRMQAAADPNPSALYHNAAVHIVEAIALGYEYKIAGSKGAPPIFAAILANAFWFLSAALRS